MDFSSFKCDHCGKEECACNIDPYILSEPPSNFICFAFEDEYRSMNYVTTTTLVQADELVLTTFDDLNLTEHFKQESTKVVVSGPGPAFKVRRLSKRRAGKKEKRSEGQRYNETYANTMEARQKAEVVRKSP
jgi:hypothetical protein